MWSWRKSGRQEVDAEVDDPIPSKTRPKGGNEKKNSQPEEVGSPDHEVMLRLRSNAVEPNEDQGREGASNV